MNESDADLEGANPRCKYCGRPFPDGVGIKRHEGLHEDGAWSE